MAGLGLLTEGEAQRFSLTKLGEALKTGAPDSARATLLMTGSSWVGSGFANLLHSLQTGRTGFEKAFGVPFFDYLAQHPEDASVFSGAMVGLHGAEPPAVAAARGAVARPGEGRAADLARQAAELYQRAIAAQRAGDWAGYGEHVSRLGEVLRQLQGALEGRQP